MAYVLETTAYVTEDGTYSSGTDIVTFDVAELNDEQWDVLADLSDSDRLPFVLACLNGEDVSEYLNDYL